MSSHSPKTSKMAWTRRGLLQEVRGRLEAAGIEAPLRNTDWILEAVLEASRAQLYAHPQQEVTPEQAARVLALAARRAAGEPLQYLLSHTDFYGLRLRVTPDVLIPRPETEEVVEEGLRLVRAIAAPRVLDAGTGSGCIALAIQHECPEAHVYACDVSEPALEVAQANAEALHLDVRFAQADLLHPGFADQMPDQLDLLISNPPYVPDVEAVTLARELTHEPALALFAGDDPLLFYRALARHANRMLRPGGFLVCETHADFGAAVRRLMAEAGLDRAALRHDLAGRPRIVTAQRGRSTRTAEP